MTVRKKRTTRNRKRGQYIHRMKDNTPIDIMDMEIGHLIATFHLKKRIGRERYQEWYSQSSSIPPNMSVDRFCIATDLLYEPLREEIAFRLRKMNPVGRKYWHWKFSHDSSQEQRHEFEEPPF